MKKPVEVLREALQHALDELNRVNASYSCVRPDVTHAASAALALTYLAPIENASEIERRIVGRLVTDLINADFELTVFNGGDEAEIKRSNIRDSVFHALGASDHDEIVVYERGGKKAGWIMLIWGNDDAVISDYSVNLDKHIDAANQLADQIAAEG